MLPIHTGDKPTYYYACPCCRFCGDTVPSAVLVSEKDTVIILLNTSYPYRKSGWRFNLEYQVGKNFKQT